MKTLIIVRHAKSPDTAPGETDFARGLTEKGKKDATDMGVSLYNSGVKIDMFVSSPARRAKKTCKAFVKAYGREKDEIQYEESLYHAGTATYNKVVSHLDNAKSSAALFGHNPGITDFVNALVPSSTIYDMPKAGVFAVSADVADWSAFESAHKTFLFFKQPG